MKVAYGFLLVIVAVVACFGYQAYILTQLQLEIKTLQYQSNENIRPKVIVLSYSWTDKPYVSSLYNRTSVNCTLLNASPQNASKVDVTIEARFGTHTETIDWAVDDVLTAWQTKNYYDLGLIYSETLGNPDTISLQLNWIG